VHGRHGVMKKQGKHMMGKPGRGVNEARKQFLAYLG